MESAGRWIGHCSAAPRRDSGSSEFSLTLTRHPFYICSVAIPPHSQIGSVCLLHLCSGWAWGCSSGIPVQCLPTCQELVPPLFVPTCFHHIAWLFLHPICPCPFSCLPLILPPIGCCPKAGAEYMVDPQQQTFAEFIFVCNLFLLLACGSRR